MYQPTLRDPYHLRNPVFPTYLTICPSLLDAQAPVDWTL